MNKCECGDWAQDIVCDRCKATAKCCRGAYFEWSVPVIDPQNIYNTDDASIWENKPKGLKAGALVALQILKIPRVALSIGMKRDKYADSPLYLDMRQFPAENVPIRVGAEVYLTPAWEQAEPALFDGQSSPPVKYSDVGVKCTTFDDGVEIFFQSEDESTADNRFIPVIYVRSAYGIWSRDWVEIDLRDATPVYRQSQVVVVPVRDGDRVLGYPQFFSNNPTDGATVSYGRLTAPNPALTTNADDLVVRFGATVLGD